MFLKAFSAFLFLVAWFPLPSQAMQFIDENYILTLRGEIRQDDTQKFLDVLKSREAGIGNMMLMVDSPGGDLHEALLMAEVIERLHVKLFVEKKKVCASACFFLYMPAGTRGAEGSFTSAGQRVLAGQLGLHRPYVRGVSDEQRFTSEQKNIMRKVAVYLESRNVPHRIMTKC